MYSDVSRGGAVDVPAVIEIYGSSGLLANVTSSFLPNDPNTFSFAETETAFVSVNLYNKPNVYVGVCEFEIWTEPQVAGPYFAVDALLTGPSVSTDSKATATINGAVVSALGAGSVVAFSGIQSTGGNVTLLATYANAGGDTVTVDITVNQVSQGQINLPATGGAYVVATKNVTLAAGKNFVSLIGGSSDISYELINFAT